MNENVNAVNFKQFFIPVNYILTVFRQICFDTIIFSSPDPKGRSGELLA